MADMIEIMARAIVEFWGEDPDRKTISNLTMVEQTMPLCRAIRDAMRTPTDAMTKAGATVTMPFKTSDADASVLVWQANVDAMEADGDE